MNDTPRVRSTRLVRVDEPTTIDDAVAVLLAGGLVALPTETVYGLGAHASNETAVRSVFAAKGRPADHPLIVHLGAADQAPAWAASLSRDAALLAEACWPGPLTLLVPRAAHVLDVVTGGRDTVGVRVPAHPVTSAVLTALEASAPGRGGVAAPSANRFGHVSPTSARHVLDDLDGLVDLVVDGGSSPVGVESTIVDCSVDPPQVLRPGGIPTEQIAELLHGRLAGAGGPSRAPGMLASHYAPRSRVLVAETRNDVERLAAAHPGAAVLGVDGDVVDLARTLYARLRAADDAGAAHVIVLLPPASGLGHAIRDRVLKAAVGRAG